MRVFAVINIADNSPTACHCFPGNYGDAMDCAMEMIWEQITCDGDRNIDLPKFITNNRDKFTKYFQDNVSYDVFQDGTVSIIEVG